MTEVLELNDNGFERGIIPGTLASLSKLQVLKLQGTQRTGDLAAFDFSGMAAIHMIYLQSKRQKVGSYRKWFARKFSIYPHNLPYCTLAHTNVNDTLDSRTGNKFLPGKMPPSLSTLTKLKVLSLRDTNRAGDMGDFDMTNLKKTLVSFNIAENPGFAAG